MNYGKNPSEVFVHNLQNQTNVGILLFTNENIFGLYSELPMNSNSNVLNQNDFIFSLYSPTVQYPVRFITNVYEENIFKLFDLNNRSNNELIILKKGNSYLEINDLHVESKHSNMYENFVDSSQQISIQNCLPQSNVFRINRIICLRFN